MKYEDRHYYRGQDVESVRMSASEEQRLFIALRANPDDARLREQIVRSYMAFALRQARKDMGRRTVKARMKCGLAEDDAISAANLGLMVAVGRFDPANGARFTTYAGWWIKKALSEARYEAHAIKVPFNDRKKYSEFSKMIRQGLRPDEVAELTGLAVAEVERILALPSGRQDSFDRVDLAPPCASADAQFDESAEAMEHEELVQKLEEAKMRLGVEELRLLHDRFSRGQSYAEIARNRKISADTAKTRIRTILGTLKILLSD